MLLYRLLAGRAANAASGSDRALGMLDESGSSSRRTTMSDSRTASARFESAESESQDPLTAYCELYAARPVRHGERRTRWLMEGRPAADSRHSTHRSMHRGTVLPPGRALMLSSPPLADLLDRLLAPHPLDRPTWADIAEHDFCRGVLTNVVQT